MNELLLKEYTQDEFDSLVEKSDLEVFTAECISRFSQDVLAKSEADELNEFEKACAAADFSSLTPLIVVGNDLIKKTVYVREAQTEVVEVPQGIFKSIDDSMCRRYKETPLNIFKGIAGINCADTEAIEKAKKGLPLGTEKTWGGKVYVKTANGWRPKAKGAKGDKEENSKPEPHTIHGKQGDAVIKEKLSPSGKKKVYEIEIYDKSAKKLLSTTSDTLDHAKDSAQTFLKELEVANKSKESGSSKMNKFAKEIEEARKIGEKLQAEHEARIARGEKIGSDDPRDHSKLKGVTD